MIGFLDRTAFSIESESYHWRDVVAAAVAWGRWAALERQTRAADALVRAARDAGVLPSAAELDAEAREFRYARDLVSADETRRWLARHDLTLERWTASLRRTLVSRRAPAGSPAAGAEESADGRMVLDDAICSGALESIGRELAARAAAAAATAAVPDEPSLDGGNGSASACPAGAAVPPPGIMPADAFARALAAVAGVDRGWQRARARALTPEQLRAQIGAHQLDWVRLDCATLAFGDVEIAREALLSVRDDGLPLADVAVAARVPLQERGFFLEEVEPPFRDRFIGAHEGELVGPLGGAQGAATIYLVRRKTLPSPDDPVVRERAERGVLQSLLGRESARRVRWAE